MSRYDWGVQGQRTYLCVRVCGRGRRQVRRVSVAGLVGVLCHVWRRSASPQATISQPDGRREHVWPSRHGDGELHRYAATCTVTLPARRPAVVNGASVCLLRHVRREWALLLFQDVCLSVCLYVCMSVGQHQMPAAPADGAAAGAAGAAAA